MSSLRKDIEKAIGAATESATIQVLREHLGPEALKQLGKIVHDRPGVGDITVERLLSGPKVSKRVVKSPGRKSKPSPFGHVDLRDRDSSERYKAKIIMVVSELFRENGTGAKISEIHEKVGGKPHQLRFALIQLRKDKRIVAKGKARACRYSTP